MRPAGTRTFPSETEKRRSSKPILADPPGISIAAGAAEAIAPKNRKDAAESLIAPPRTLILKQLLYLSIKCYMSHVSGITRKKNQPGRHREGAPAWYLLIHQLPPEPLYLRAKIRQRLTKVGAVALKNAVYVLPRLEDCLEDFEWIGPGGDRGRRRGLRLRGGLPGGRDQCRADPALPAGSRRRLCGACRVHPPVEPEGKTPERRQSPGGRSSRRAWPVPAGASTRSRASTSSGRRGVTRPRGCSKLWSVASSRLRSRVMRRKSRIPDLSNRTWVTRKGIKVDRIASAWLIRRFIDAGARFRFIDPKRETARPGGDHLRHGRRRLHARGRPLHVRDAGEPRGNQRRPPAADRGDRPRDRPEGRKVRAPGDARDRETPHGHLQCSLPRRGASGPGFRALRRALRVLPPEETCSKKEARK